MAKEPVNLSQVQNAADTRTVSYPENTGENFGRPAPDLRLVATIASAKALLHAAREIRDMLKIWAEFCIAGPAAAIVLPSREQQAKAPGSVDPFWIMLHIERFFDLPGNIVFREWALQAYGRHATTADAMYHWQWRQPGEPAAEAFLRHGWARVGIRDKDDPLPELVAEFGKRMLAWHIQNPPRPVIATLEERIGDRALDGDDPDRRLVSVRTACMLLELRDRGTRYPLRSMQRWCQAGKFKTAVKHADWLISVGELRRFERPKQGRKNRRKKSAGVLRLEKNSL